jgi:dynein heavy chain
MRGGNTSFNQSITGIKTASELKPALQVKQNSRLMGKGHGLNTTAMPSKLPPMKLSSRSKLDEEQSPNKSMTLQEPYGYDDFGASNITMVPMSDQARNKIFSCPVEWKKRKVEITKIRAGEEDDFDREYNSSDRQDGKDLNDIQKVQNAVNNKEWVDLDKYIELLLDSKSEDEIVFIHCNPNPNGDPYDLEVVGYDERNEEKYYTMSGKGLMLHENDRVTEFISLAQWLINRDSYNHIKELRFFKKFKKWKFMKLWKDTIKKESRKQATNKLKDKLFILHDTFKNHLLTHRDYCKKMEDLRFIDSGSNIETQKIKEFSKNQSKMRLDTNKRIGQFSGKCRENVESCINKVLQDLKQRIDAETKLDEERKRVNPIQSTTTLAVKDKQSHNVFEELGFPPGMTYGHCSSLREECSRFIRFAYLIDFMSLDSLSGIYLGSIEGITNRLRYLDANCSLDDLMDVDLNDSNNTPAAPIRGLDPLFVVNLEFHPENDIPQSAMVKQETEDFKPPPHGTSLPKDFDLLTHLELEPEIEEGKEIEDEEESDENVDPMFAKIFKDTCPDIHNQWLKITPSRDDFANLFEKMFIDCNNEIKAFERFSKHPSLKIYADALEEWDDRIGGEWQEPDELMLDPVEWIKDNKIYTDKTTNINSILKSCYDKAESFTSRFNEVLQMYWQDKK